MKVVVIFILALAQVILAESAADFGFSNDNNTNGTDSGRVLVEAIVIPLGVIACIAGGVLIAVALIFYAKRRRMSYKSID